MQCQSQVEPSGGALRSLAVGGSGAGRAGCVQGAANVLLGPLTACAGVAAACGAGEGGRFTYSRFVAVVGAAALPRTSTLFALLALSPHHHQTPARLHACLTASPPPRCRPPPPARTPILTRDTRVQPDLIIGTAITYGAPHCAEALGVPFHTISTIPWRPTEVGDRWSPPRAWTRFRMSSHLMMVLRRTCLFFYAMASPRRPTEAQRLAVMMSHPDPMARMAHQSSPHRPPPAGDLPALGARL